MANPLEHNYIGSAEVPSMSKAPTFSIGDEKGRHLKTELSLGLPGSGSPHRKTWSGVTLFGQELEGNLKTGLSIGSAKTSASGAKRVFSDAISASDKWVLPIKGRSDCNLSKDGVLHMPSSKPVQENQLQVSAANEHSTVPAVKEQVVGWPPIRCFRKNSMASASAKNNGDTDEKLASAFLYVKVSMDGAPYLRKVDLQTCTNYVELSSELEKMFNCLITGQYGSNEHAKREGPTDNHSTDNNLGTSEYVLTYEDKDGDWMLVGDVPWKMFTENCRKLRIMKASEAIGLASGEAEQGTVEG